jgi:DNA polymerase I-like protein with 3'-5' exonuclease and polymerase domains
MARGGVPASGRDPGQVPVTLVSGVDQLGAFAADLRSACALAIDTETVYGVGDGDHPGALRVVSAATRDAAGQERAWVLDARDVEAACLAPVLDGLTADAWNATFDARVLDAAVFGAAGYPRDRGVTWWDAQLADALLHAGVTGFGWFHGLAWATERYLGIEAAGKGTVQLSYDATTDLTSEQVAYAAADAVETLWVADVLRERLREARLEDAAGLEMAARPFLDHLQREGLPFDREGYGAYLAERAGAMASCLTRLAELTGGGQGSLFSADLEPVWNPSSEPQTKAALNRWAADRVARYMKARSGEARPLTDTDPLDATALGEIGGPLAETLLAYRAHAKLLSAYGDNLTPFLGDDGRFHPQYVQVVGVNTGRLSSRNPNAQTFPPEMKPFVRPATADRVFVHADVSQAELRWLAQVSGDGALRDAFRAGRDVHVSTAERMFRVDMAALAVGDPARHKALRARAKAINFGIVYGQGAQALGRSLTLGGSPTDQAEAQGLLDAYLHAYPGVAAWLARQDRVVDAVGARAAEVDWLSTLRLYDDLVPVAAFRREFRDRHRRWPTRAEILEALPTVAEWALRYEDPIVLLDVERPLSWSSRTLAGRRRRFTVATSAVLRRAALAAATSERPSTARAVREFAAGRGLVLPPGGPALDRVFDDRPLRRALLDWLWRELGEGPTVELLGRAAADGVRAAGNAHRNAPIQGGVADAMLAAYAELWARIAGDDQLAPVLTVHDSLVVECPLERAGEVSAVVRAALEAGFARFCPDVPLEVDLDVRPSLAPLGAVDRGGIDPLLGGGRGASADGALPAGLTCAP